MELFSKQSFLVTEHIPRSIIKFCVLINQSKIRFCLFIKKAKNRFYLPIKQAKWIHKIYFTKMNFVYFFSQSQFSKIRIFSNFRPIWWRTSSLIRKFWEQIRVLKGPLTAEDPPLAHLWLSSQACKGAKKMCASFKTLTTKNLPFFSFNRKFLTIWFTLTIFPNKIYQKMSHFWKSKR